MHFSQPFFFSLFLFSQALGLAISPRHALYGRSNSGVATHYGGNLQGGACGFSTLTSLPPNVYGTASADWDAASHCGQCVSVTGGPNGNTITAMIVDQCPGCQTNQLDLFPDAFTALNSDPSAGVIQISWDYIDCPISWNLQLVNKQGVSPYWFSMQVIDATEQVTDFEVSSDGGSTWTPVTRDNDNFFTLSSGTQSNSVDVKLTSASGAVITVNDVAINPGQTVTASSNFPTNGSSSSSSASPSASSSSTAAPSTSAAPEESFPDSQPASTGSASGGDDDDDNSDLCDA